MQNTFKKPMVWNLKIWHPLIRQFNLHLDSFFKEIQKIKVLRSNFVCGMCYTKNGDWRGFQTAGWEKFSDSDGLLRMGRSLATYTVPFHSIRQSHITGPRNLPKCHGHHGKILRVPKFKINSCLKIAKFEWNGTVCMNHNPTETLIHFDIVAKI